MVADRIRSWSASGWILLLLLLSVVAYSQEEELILSLKVSKQPLSFALDRITKETGYFLTFDSRLADEDRLVSIELDSVSLQSAIDTLFQRTDLTYRIINKNIVIYPAPDELLVALPEERADSPGIIEVRGSVRDIRSGKPLPFATLALMDTYFGTIANEDGNFLIRFPDTIQNPVFIASYIGYKDHYLPISVISEEPVVLSMHKNVISLQEVIIRYQDPLKLMQDALNRIKDNYMAEEAGMKVYYRESVNKEEECLLYSEAVFEIAKASYTRGLTTDRHRLLKGRKLTNVDQQDTVVMKIRAGFSSLLSLDIVKNRPEFLSPDFLLLYDLSFSGIVSFKDRQAYVVSFRQKENVEELLFEGKLYLDRESLAIVAADFRFDPARIQSEPERFIAKKSRKLKLRPVKAEYYVEYRTNGSGYFLSQVQGDVTFKIRKRRQWISSKYSISIDMAVTDVQPGKPPRIRLNEQLKPSTVLSDYNFSYDAEFWGSMTTIMPELSLAEALERIEKSILEINQ